MKKGFSITTINLFQHSTNQVAKKLHNLESSKQYILKIKEEEKKSLGIMY